MLPAKHSYMRWASTAGTWLKFIKHLLQYLLVLKWSRFIRLDFVGNCMQPPEHRISGLNHIKKRWDLRPSIPSFRRQLLLRISAFKNILFTIWIITFRDWWRTVLYTIPLFFENMSDVVSCCSWNYFQLSASSLDSLRPACLHSFCVK